ncbi:hypothetical protein Bhyg_10047 [Pseudolycoriella hygida]|uniref:Single domain-containing protein n=1 Tax=Pseudolycoriella hygida TaxID=35572 RepID=A0A9Q0MVL5_9DIPT|nr:hypothetical protein Bhyg_10047 [Pseudolycoriella hygida]
MKTCFVLCVLSALVYTEVWAATMQVLHSEHKDYPNKCYVEMEKKAYPPGEHHPEGKCYEILCHNDYSYTVNTCGVVIAQPGYHNEIDYTQPYPDCCVNIVKDKD